MKKVFKLSLASLVAMSVATQLVQADETTPSTTSQTSTTSSTQVTSTSTTTSSSATATTESNASQEPATAQTEAQRQALINSLSSAPGLSFPMGRSDLHPQKQARSLVASSMVNISNGISADVAGTPGKGFIDVSSHNGFISVAAYQKMKAYGVTGVVVKLTEATSYINPYATQQVANAKAAGMKVSAYHYSWFSSESAARNEANYFVAAARSIGLDNNTVMVNDFEEKQIFGMSNHTKDSLAFADQLAKNGYNNVVHYSFLSLFNSGVLNVDSLGKKNIWVAAYPYTVTSENYYPYFTAWQWTSQLTFPGIRGNFDISADYDGRFTSNSALDPAAGATAVYRAYNPNTGEHVYTINTNEYLNVLSLGWQGESVAWNAAYEGNPIYRVYNPNTGEHFYTLDSNEADYLQSVGWQKEGISFYSSFSQEIPIYRVFNPNATGPGSHHFTTNEGERDVLVSRGWRNEGIAFYGIN